MSLIKQALSGLVWSSIDVLVLKGLSFVASIVLARVLGPAKFGLIGMIYIFIAIGNTLIDSGLTSSIIRTKDLDDRDYSTVFYMNLIVSALVYALSFILAPYIASFYNQAVLTNIIRVYCLSFVFSAFSAIQITVLMKDMQFKKLTYCNIPGTVIGVVVGITMGSLGYGVLSIVWMYLSTQIVQTVVLWFFSNWKPSFIFSIEKLKFHFKFGYKLMLSGLLNTIFNNIYNVIIGRYYAVQSLGYYERAYTFNDYPVNILTGIISKVSYPLLANIQDEKEKVSLAYKQILQVAFFITAPLMLGAAAISKPLFSLVLGTQWLPAVPFFKILCLASIFYPIHSFNINVLKIFGRTDLFLKLEVIKKIVILISVFATFSFGVYGLVWSSVFTSFIALVINMHYSSRLINYTTGRQLLDMLPVFIISCSMYVFMYFVTRMLTNYNGLMQITIGSLSGLITYIIMNYIFRISPFIFTLNLIKHRRQR